MVGDGAPAHTQVLGHHLDSAVAAQVVWIRLWTTPDMPAPIQQKLREATLKALQDPKLRETFATMRLAIDYRPE